MVQSDARGPLPQREPDLLFAWPQGDRVRAIDHRRQRRIPAQPVVAGRRRMARRSQAHLVFRRPDASPVHARQDEGALERPDRFTASDLSFPAGRRSRAKCWKGLTNTLGVPVVEHYGSSEAAQISANLPPPGPFKPGTCGIPAKGAVKIVAESGREVSPGEHGEILLGGPTLTSGYLDAPELNRVSFVDGWFRTGDIGSFDARRLPHHSWPQDRDDQSGRRENLARGGR